MAGTHFLDRKNDLDLEKAFTAMILTDSLAGAIEVLKEQGFTTTEPALEQLRSNHHQRDRYEARRNELAPVLEGMHANDLLDTARLATTVSNIAIAKTRELLEDGKIRDPAVASKVARDLSQVSTQSIDKRLAVQGRPTHITEHRDLTEIVRALASLAPGAVQFIDTTAEEGDVDGPNP